MKEGGSDTSKLNFAKLHHVNNVCTNFQTKRNKAVSTKSSWRHKIP